MSLRFHEIAEANHSHQNPLTDDQLALVGEIVGFQEKMRVLDLACGKGEMLSRWARDHGIIGVGVDLSPTFIEAAQQRADELEILDQVHFVVDDAATYPQPFHAFDVVSCIGATWIGDGLVGTLELMQTALKPKDGLLLVGEPYWHEIPPYEAAEALGALPDTFATLAGMLERVESAGLELVEMVLADLPGWDRYESRQWMTVDTYLRENPDEPEREALRQWIKHARWSYLNFGRKYMGWGVFVLRPGK
jgi:SAM-dependent methyltransferase